MMQSLSQDELKKVVLSVVEPCLTGQVAFTAKDIVTKVRQKVGPSTFIGYNDVVNALKEIHLAPYNFMVSQIDVTDAQGESRKANLYHHNLDLWDLESAYPQEFRAATKVKDQSITDDKKPLGEPLELFGDLIVQTHDETQDELPEQLKTASQLWDELSKNNCFFA